MSKPALAAAVISLTTTAVLITNATLANTDSLSFEKLDSNNNGLISPSEGQAVPELKNLWDRLDEDDSGTLDRQEFRAIKEIPNPSTHQLAFDKLDQNNNGYITPVEAREAPRLQEMWSQIDDDNSGAIDRNEFDTFEGGSDKTRGLLKQQRFDELDENRDGVISVGEVRHHPELRPIWPEVDADNSGAVDRMEFTRWAGAKEGTEMLAEAPPFERLDKDSNGYISAEEGREQPLLRRNWSQFDTDRNGAIDQQEFSAFEERLQQGKAASGDMKQETHEKAKEQMRQGQNQ